MNYCISEIVRSRYASPAGPGPGAGPAPCAGPGGAGPSYRGSPRLSCLILGPGTIHSSKIGRASRGAAAPGSLVRPPGPGRGPGRAGRRPPGAEAAAQQHWQRTVLRLAALASEQ